MNDPKHAKEVNKKSNLMKLLMHGFAFRLKVDISPNSYNLLRKMFLKEFQQIVDTYFSEKIANFAIKALKGLSMRVKLSPQESHELFDTYLSQIEIPDAADLVDELGMQLIENKLITYYDNVPYIREFIDALHDLARCNFEIGYTNMKRTLSVQMHTQGIKEIFDLIMLGMVEK